MRSPRSVVLFCHVATLLLAGRAVAQVPQEEIGVAAPSTQVVRAGTFGRLPALEPDRDFHASDPELARLLGIVLRENPDILAARRSWLSSLERPAQVRSLPDPRVGVRYFAESLETRVGPQRQSLELAQPVPWLSKLSTAGRRAERLAASLMETVRQIERDRVREFKRSYYDLAYFVEALRINEQERRLLHKFEQTSLMRYSTGEGIQQNVIKVQTEITRLIDQATSLAERRDILKRRLARIMGRPEASVEIGHISLSEPVLRYDPRALEHAAVRVRPALGALRERVRADELLVRRRRLEFRPDFTFGLSITDIGRRTDPAGRLAPPPDNGRDALAFLASVRIPLYARRISSGIREAREILSADLQRLDREQDQVRFDVQEATLRLDSLLERTALYRDNLVPQAEQALSSSEAAYQTNQIDFLDLIDAERIWFEVRLTYRRLLSDLWIAMSDLERAIGKRFPDQTVGLEEPSQ
ncbi:MAG: TolC family protein [Acidobacteriota bacterium]